MLKHACFLRCNSWPCCWVGNWEKGRARLFEKAFGRTESPRGRARTREESCCSGSEGRLCDEKCAECFPFTWSVLDILTVTWRHRHRRHAAAVALHQQQSGGFVSCLPRTDDISPMMFHGRGTDSTVERCWPRKCGWKYSIKPFQGKCQVSRGQTCGGVCNLT